MDKGVLGGAIHAVLCDTGQNLGLIPRNLLLFNVQISALFDRGFTVLSLERHTLGRKRIFRSD